MTRRRRPLTAQERVIGALGTVASGALGGRVRNSRPAVVQQRNTGQPPPSVVFDPDADPVIIGIHARGSLHSVAIGTTADATGDSGVAVGSGTGALGLFSVAVGNNAGAFGDYSVTIGENATVNTGADGGVAVGPSAGVASGAVAGTAVGSGAFVGHSDATALGVGASTTKPHQLMLGTATEFAEIPGSGLVLKDTATSTRYLLQITSGALVLNTAP